MTFLLYDFAGFDGLAVAKKLFGDAIDRIAAFQSADYSILHEHLSTEHLSTDHQSSSLPYAVLRLCENNFRVRVPVQQQALFQTAFSQAQRGQRVWLQQFDWLGRLSVPEAMLPALTDLIVPKAPHRIVGLGLNCAAPGRINATAVLVWRHQVMEAPAVELHLSTSAIESVKALLS